MPTVNIVPSMDVSMNSGGVFGQTNWNNAHDSTSGSIPSDTHKGSDSAANILGWFGNRVSNIFGTNYWRTKRVWFDIDVASSVLAGATITSATFNIKGRTFSAGFGKILGDTDLILVKGNYDSSSAATTQDIDAIAGFEAGWDDEDATTYSDELSEWVVSADASGDYNEFTMTSDAITDMQTHLDAETKFQFVMMEHSYDYNDVAPSNTSLVVEGNYFTIRESNTSHRPYMAITYTTTAPAGVLTLNSGVLDITSGKLEL